IYAVAAIGILTFLNIMGVRQGTGTQNALTALLVLGILAVITAGFVAGSPESSAQTPANSSSALGGMMLFVLFTYGGWNEAAYISGELRDVRRNMARVLVVSILLIT